LGCWMKEFYALEKIGQWKSRDPPSYILIITIKIY
jgi:hypothetical protein